MSIVLAEWPRNRPFKPSKTVQRILAYCWGAETDDWPEGAQMRLFRDEKVKWAGEEVGGIRVSHLSHIKGEQKIALQESKHKKSLHRILPLPDAPAAPAPTAQPVGPKPETLQRLNALFGEIDECALTLRHCFGRRVVPGAQPPRVNQVDFGLRLGVLWKSLG